MIGAESRIEVPQVDETVDQQPGADQQDEGDGDFRDHEQAAEPRSFAARRSAISFCRTAARARRRFATFAHAIRSTNPTAPSSTSSAGRMSPTTSSCSGLTTVLMRRLVLGYCWASRAAIVSISAWACLSVIPGFVRA